MDTFFCFLTIAGSFYNAPRFNFELGYKDLGFYDFDGNYTVERGKFNIYVGANSLTDNYLQIEII